MMRISARRWLAFSRTRLTARSSPTRPYRAGAPHPARIAAKPADSPGRPLFARSTRFLAKCYLACVGKLPLIGVGGIDSAETALAKIRAGASLIQLYTGLVYAGPALLTDIKAALHAEIEKGPATLASLVGTEAERWAAS